MTSTTLKTYEVVPGQLFTGYYIAQPKYEPSFKYDMMNFLAGPYATHAAAEQMLLPFTDWFFSQYPGERSRPVIVGLVAPQLPVGRFNAMGYEPPPFKIGYNP